MAHGIERDVYHVRILAGRLQLKNVFDYMVGRTAWVCTGTGK